MGKMSIEKIQSLLQTKKDLFTENETLLLNKILESAKLKEEENYNYDLSLEYKTKGNEYFKKGDFIRAIDFYTLAIKHAPDTEIFYSNRAAALAKLNRVEEGIKDCEWAITINPHFFKAWVKLGAFHFDKDKNKSLKYYQRAQQLEPENELVNNRIKELEYNSNINLDNIVNMAQEMTKDKSKDELGDMLNSLSEKLKK